MTRNRTSTEWMGKRYRRRRVLRHGPKARATDVAAIATGAGGAVVAADADPVAGTEAATTVVDAEADGKRSCRSLVASF